MGGIAHIGKTVYQLDTLLVATLIEINPFLT